VITQVLHKIVSVTLAFVVLFSSLFFTVEKHICMDEITDVSYFTSADSCGMIAEICDIKKPSHTQFEKENCCDNVQELIPGNQNEQQALPTFEIEQAQFVLAFAYTYVGLFEQQEYTPFSADTPPPLIDKNIYLLHQTFLI